MSRESSSPSSAGWGGPRESRPWLRGGVMKIGGRLHLPEQVEDSYANRSGEVGECKVYVMEKGRRNEV